MIEIRQTSEFTKWLRNLRDANARLRINQRLFRLQRGNVGDAKSVGRKVMELRIDYGPGYRVYFTQTGDTIVVLLCGGDKRTQQADIARAQKLAEQWKN